MTTKDKIKALIAANNLIAQVIGAMPHSDECEDKQENASRLMLASNTMQDVIYALCDELPDHIADPGKMVVKPGSIFIYDSNGDKAFCPRCRTLCCLECENPKKRGEKRLGYCAVCHEFFETDCDHIVEATK